MQLSMTGRFTIVAVFGLCAAAGCGGDDDVFPDATGADAATVDAADVDAAIDAAPGPCPGALLFTGDYVDWDSTDMAFAGVPGAVAVEVGNESNTAMTAPNGRIVLCLPAATESLVKYTHGSYLDMQFQVAPAALQNGVFSTKGLKPARADSLLTSLIGAASDPAKAQVLVEVRRFPVGDLVSGAEVAIGSANAGAFAQDSLGAWGAGAATTESAWVFFANVEVGAGTTTVDVTHTGSLCQGPANLNLAANTLTVTTYNCNPS